MVNRNNRVCPLERAGRLDSKLRRWVQNPRKILAPYLTEGMTALDLGCGPGYFTLEITQLVGKSGRVIAVDMQEGMLQIIREKIHGTELEPRITLHQCRQDALGVSEPVDFLLAFYMIHEVPDKPRLFSEVARLLKPTGRMLIVEPPFHVATTAFTAMLATAEQAGLSAVERPKMWPSLAVVLRKG